MSAFTDEDYRRVLNERDEALARVDSQRSQIAFYRTACTARFLPEGFGDDTMRELIKELTEERDEALAEMERLRVKAEAYGGMVHGCGPVLESAGHTIDPFHPDGRVGGIARSVAALVKERDEARAEVEHAYREGGALYEAKIAEREAFSRGAEAMREACARWMSEREGIAKWVYDDALSALPIPEEP